MAKNINEISQYIQERRNQKSAAAVTASDPDDKGEVSIPANGDKPDIAKTVPPGGLDTKNTGKAKDMTDENVRKSGEKGPQDKTPPTVSEPEQISNPANKMAAAVLSILRNANAGTDTTKKADDAGKGGDNKLVNFDETYYEKLATEFFPLADLGLFVMQHEDLVKQARAAVNQARGMEAGEELIKQAFAASEDYATYQQNQEHMSQSNRPSLAEKTAGTRTSLLEAISQTALFRTEKQASVQTPSELVEFEKTASAAAKDFSEEEYAAFLEGVKQAAALADAGGDMGEVSEEPTIEEVVAMLEQMVENGEITEEEAAQVLAEITGEGGAGGGEEDMAAMAGEALA